MEGTLQMVEGVSQGLAQQTWSQSLLACLKEPAACQTDATKDAAYPAF